MYLVFAESSPISLQKINVLSLSVLGAYALVVPLLPLFFLLLKRWYLHPMEQMEAALQKIRRGQMDVRFQEDQKEMCIRDSPVPPVKNLNAKKLEK